MGYLNAQNSKILTKTYRKDIDGLRSIAIISVILFHFGYLPNGYLGVDVFFVISGYLITNIIFKESVEDRFSVTRFYLRRIRRIIPLILFTSFVALIIGMFVMIPNDLDSLSQSVIATNSFANNILLYITTGNYWNIVNEFKPLMHTWSLGIEEQYYLFYPLIFLLLKGEKIRWILPTLILLTVISLFLFICDTNEASRFYLIPFRFYELSLGGIGAIYLKKLKIFSRFRLIPILILLLILIFNINIADNVKLFLSVVATLGILISESNQKSISTFALENKLMVGIGKISFSLYMWHQIVLAYTRYFILENINIFQYVLILLVTIFLSVFSYYLIEQPFRTPKKIKTSVLFWIIGSAFILSMCVSLYIYFNAGVIRDVPELGITKSNVQRSMHTKYNSRIFDFDREFTKNDKIKVLVIGDSFARDWANVLLESKFKNSIEISYIADVNNFKNLKERLSKAKYIFFSATIIDKSEYNALINKFGLNRTNIWIIGTKNFGVNNGIFYNKRHNSNYFSQRTHMVKWYYKENESMKKKWENKYIDLIGEVIDNHGMVPVFTPDHKFISEDCRHLTQGGAMYYSQILENDLSKIFGY